MCHDENKKRRHRVEALEARCERLTALLITCKRKCGCTFYEGGPIECRCGAAKFNAPIEAELAREGGS